MPPRGVYPSVNNEGVITAVNMKPDRAVYSRTPTTGLDQRFSDANSEPLSWPDTVELIANAPLFWVTTVRSDGRPHSTPLVAVWLDDALQFSTGETEQKAHNLANNPHVLLTTGDNRWEAGFDVVIEGDAVRITDDPQLARLADLWRTKWDGQWVFEARDGAFHFPNDGGTAMVFRVEPNKVLAFGKGTFTHTSHRF
jgi:general stress protein 26